MKKSIKELQQQLSQTELLDAGQKGQLKGGFIIVSDTDIM